MNVPQSLEAEQAVLGCCLIEPASIIQVMDKLSLEMFWAERHRMIWEVLIALTERAVPPDMIAVTEELKARKLLDKIGGVAYLSQLPMTVTSTEHIEHYAAIVRQKYVRRKMIQAAQEIAQLAQDEDRDLGEQAAEAEKMLYEATNAESEGRFRPIGEIAYEFWDYAYGHRDEGPSGVKTGFWRLDIATGGLQPGDLIILAARPGQGKTTLAMQIAYNVANELKRPVAFFSLEMTQQQISNRLLVGLGKFNNQAIRMRNLQPAEWDAGFQLVNSMSDVPLFVDDQAGLTLAQVRARTRRLKAEKRDLGLVVIDYLQLMRPTRGKSRDEQIGLIAQGLKELAKELNVPVLTLSQLNRAVEMQVNKRPTLANLRESGNIEQAADVVIFIYQPDESKTERELIIAKQRMLPAGTVKGFDFNNAWFSDIGREVLPGTRIAKEAKSLFERDEDGI